MIKGLIAALQFLTRIPVNISVDFNKKNLSKATFFFPYVGMLIGLIAGIVGYYMRLLGGDEIGAVFAVLALVVVTGGLHIDGLSDTSDGFFSGRSKERVLEIMKDSRTGTFGVVAVVMDLLLKFVIISKLRTSMFIPSLMLASGNARLTVVMLMAYMKNARPGGMGSMFSDSKPQKYFYAALIIYLIVIIFGFGLKFLIPLGIAFITSGLITLKAYKTIGGLTGDVYGANIEICEIVSLFTFMVASIWI
ncbi:adenosylcobinamide-GDP ribazoletransferase [Clostridium hydrogenum]|uniref:adenosylcobinamide-GDP ribazoletransferase n=1 Tax=Clostridium hydrogenum TaxID=2855764 RepID=UPI001F252715|nr:adenosylcobinamide-GDP ribazoletransferase [Clostridium hydrogenum]